MARVTVEDCIDKVDNRFDLVLMASHRARAISSGAQISVQRDNDKNPVVALREIGDGKLRQATCGRMSSTRCRSMSRSTSRKPRPRRRWSIRTCRPDRSRADVQFDRMTEEDLLRGLEGLTPPPEPEDEGE